MIERGAITETEAANLEPDYLDGNPEAAADDELSYWPSDG